MKLAVVEKLRHQTPPSSFVQLADSLAQLAESRANFWTTLQRVGQFWTTLQRVSLFLSRSFQVILCSFFSISSPKLLKYVYRFCQDLNQGFQVDHQNHERVAYFQAFNKRLSLLNSLLFCTIRQSIAQKQLCRRCNIVAHSARWTELDEEYFTSRTGKVCELK